MEKTVLASAILASLFSGMSAAASNFDDFCYTDDNGYYDCSLLDENNGNTLDLDGHSFADSTEIYISNELEASNFIVKNFSLNEISTDYVYDADKISEDGYDRGLIKLHNGEDITELTLDGWNINVEQQTHSLILNDMAHSISDTGTIGSMTINNSLIKANADTLISYSELYIYDDTLSGIDQVIPVELFTLNNSTLINTKQHTDFDGRPTDPYDSPEDPMISSDHGSIMMFQSIYDVLHGQKDISFHINLNDSYLEASSFATINLIDYSENKESSYNLNLKNSEGQFKNLLFRTGEVSIGSVLKADNININLDNSTITSGIYSEEHGSYRNTHTVMNLANNSVFNYLGGCTDNCNFYGLEESYDPTDPWDVDENSEFLTEHRTDSYIHQINITGNSTLAFSSEGNFKQFYVDEMTSDGTANLIMNTNLTTSEADHLFLKKASGEFNVMVNDHGTEPNPNTFVALITVETGRDSNFLLNKGKGVDIGAYVYDLKKLIQGEQYVWFLKQQAQNDSDPNCNVCTDNEQSKPIVTSPSTDAVLSLASANQFILNDELQNLRMRRGDVMSNNHASGNVWGRLINNRLSVDGPANSSYKMNRAGMELGTDKVFHFDNDRLMLGMTGSLSDNKVKHSRGGTSDVDAYSVGLYATYFTESNFYLDGTIKYTHFNNRLNAVTTNGSNVTSDYKQHGFGTALEFGYHYQNGAIFVEPYGRMSYVDVQGKSITLSNGLTAKIDNQKSLLGEVGVSAGVTAYSSDSMTISPYAKLAFEHEFLKDNHVTINNAHEFSNDFSGTAGKYGAGVNVTLGKNTSIFGEVNYVKGRNIESPIKANVGFRISF